MTSGFRVVLYIQDEPQKEYVTDGLLAYYDAENNTGTGHSFATTTWKDLSGNNNDATLSGFDGTDASGWHSNYLAFDGVDDYATGAFNSNGDITVEFIAKKNDNNNATMFMMNNWSANIVKPSLQLYTNGSMKFYRMSVPANTTQPYDEIGWQKIGYISNNTKPMCVYTVTKGNNIINIFNNGQHFSNYTDSSFVNRYDMNNTSFTIGKWHHYDGYYSTQNVYAMRVYNRALTEDEIRQNYEIDKVRFNIQE